MSNTEENIRYWVSLFPEYRDEKRISELLEKMLGKNIHQLAEEAEIPSGIRNSSLRISPIVGVSIKSDIVFS